MVKNLPGSAGDVRDAGSIPGLGRSPEEGVATHSNILAWRIPWTEEPGIRELNAQETVVCSFQRSHGAQARLPRKS